MSVTAAAGFESAGVACGIKPPGVPDLAMVATSDRRPASAAGVFTTNLACAAPVQVSRRHLHDGRAGAVVLNSGNANAATGSLGRSAALRMCEGAASHLRMAAHDVLVCSTGLIGIPLPIETIEAGFELLVADLGSDDDAGKRAADAILTTDTVRKEARAVAVLDAGIGCTVGGMAKGAAMLAPAMATMLAVVTTDACVEPFALQAALDCAVQDTFNALIVDGCTSTNDSVLVLANGVAGNEPIPAEGPAFGAFVDALGSVCEELAVAMAADAEGATKLARVIVRGARSTDEARRAARAVASSQLVQCSLYGADPYWGRVMSELGASGAYFDPGQIHIAYNGITVCREGVAAPHDEAALAAAMAGRVIEITCDLHQGLGRAQVHFTDLTHAYIDENKGTS